MQIFGWSYVNVRGPGTDDNDEVVDGIRQQEEEAVSRSIEIL